MARGRRSSRGAGLGAVLIVLLLAAVIAGGFAVWRAAKRQSDAAAARQQAAQQQPSTEPAPAPEPEPAAPQPDESLSRAVDPDVSALVEPGPEDNTVTLMALGDNLIHNTIYWSAEQPDGSYDFTPVYEEIAKVAAEYDLACINQETIYVNDPALYANYPAFGTPTQVGDALAGAGFDVVTHATNHCYDKLDTGIVDTLGFWRENYPDMAVLGIHDSQEAADTIRVVEKDGLRLALLNYTYGLNYSAPANKYMVDTLIRDEVRADLEQAEAQADFTAVFVHWGEEGQTRPTQSQRDWAQFMADNGADLIIGSHPHVLQPLETVTSSSGREVPVFYSLGNFVSHQLTAIEMLGGMASVELTKTGEGVAVTACELVPTINVIIYRGYSGGFDYRPMLLRNYTEELARQHWIEGTGAEQMWNLWGEITG
ncbi:MAG: CapA family protein [Oscillospiraceae bacterium]